MRSSLFCERAALGPTRKTSSSTCVFVVPLPVARMSGTDGILGGRVGGCPDPKDPFQGNPERFGLTSLDSGGKEGVEEAIDLHKEVNRRFHVCGVGLFGTSTGWTSPLLASD